MSTRREYEGIDIHKAQASAWPATIPPMTEEDARKAIRRLWRFALGHTLELPIEVTSGRRYNWMRNRTVYVNPSKGWREFVHDWSHYFVRRANPEEKPHSKFHARFEAKLVREVIKRGWLDGTLRAPEKPATAQPTKDDERRLKLARLQARMLAWERKQARAERAIAKIRKQARYYERVLQAS